MALGKGLGRMIPTDEIADTKVDKKKSSVSGSSKSAPLKKSGSKDAAVSQVDDKKSEVFVKLSDIEPNVNQPRKDFNEDSLVELADSIKKYGVIEPLIVTKKGKMYQIIAGERRWRASRIAGIKEIPVIIRDYTDKERMEIALIENLQREDLNPIEEALAYQSLIDEYHLKQDEVAERVSKSRSTITNALRLLKLSDKVRQMVVDDMLSTGHARALLAIEDADVQYETALTVFDEGLSVRDTERLVKSVNNILNGNTSDKDKAESKVDNSMEAILSQLQEQLKNTLGSKVTIKPRTNSKGKIEIEYISNDDLERIIHIINSGSEK